LPGSPEALPEFPPITGWPAPSAEGRHEHVACSLQVAHGDLRGGAGERPAARSRKLGASGYTITDARGRGARGVRDAAWSESANIRVEVLCSEPTAEAIVQDLKQRYYANYAMVLFMADVVVLRVEKF
jgi:hypothetical protein